MMEDGEEELQLQKTSSKQLKILLLAVHGGLVIVALQLGDKMQKFLKTMVAMLGVTLLIRVTLGEAAKIIQKAKKKLTMEQVLGVQPPLLVPQLMHGVLQRRVKEQYGERNLLIIQMLLLVAQALLGARQHPPPTAHGVLTLQVLMGAGAPALQVVVAAAAVAGEPALQVLMEAGAPALQVAVAVAVAGAPVLQVAVAGATVLQVVVAVAVAGVPVLQVAVAGASALQVVVVVVAVAHLLAISHGLGRKLVTGSATAVRNGIFLLAMSVFLAKRRRHQMPK
jgi:hypothetical protein